MVHPDTQAIHRETRAVRIIWDKPKVVDRTTDPSPDPLDELEAVVVVVLTSHEAAMH